MKTPMLTVENLSVSFTQYQRGLRQRQIEVISDLSVAAFPGEILAIVGASGSGKSLLAHAILGILPSNATVKGTMLYQGQPLDKKRQGRLRGSEIALIPQSINCLNPLLKVGAQVGEKGTLQDIARRDIFKRFGLPDNVAGLYPHELSGGMARRVLVAAAVIGGAKLIIADEPTPGLHPEVAMDTLMYLRQQADAGAAVVLITHDIGTALQVADRVSVFFAGTNLELAQKHDFIQRGEKLRHPYSKALWKALPQNDFAATCARQPALQGRNSGCIFEAVCEHKTAECCQHRPPMRELREGKVRCHHAT